MNAYVYVQIRLFIKYKNSLVASTVKEQKSFSLKLSFT
jgi:hypothetical protein